MSDARADAYQEITDQIVAMLEQGVAPWRMAWDPELGLPRSMSTGKGYRGANPFLLQISAMVHGFESPWWGTYRAVQEVGGQVRKGEKSTNVVFWKTYTKNEHDEATGEDAERSRFVLRSFRVFNADQCDGDLKLPAVETRGADHDPIAACEAVMADYVARGPHLTIGTSAAYYSPVADMICLPLLAAFDSAEEFYAAGFHEAGHSTGHTSRLDRPGVMTAHKFGSVEYGKEELCAEMTAAFLCAATGIAPATIDNSASYLASWLKTIKGDPKLVVQAAAQAQRAADCVQGITFEMDTPETPAITPARRQPVAAGELS